MWFFDIDKERIKDVLHDITVGQQSDSVIYVFVSGMDSRDDQKISHLVGAYVGEHASTKPKKAGIYNTRTFTHSPVKKKGSSCVLSFRV